jgi:Xaa-Pro aminopeptidase
VQPGAVVLIDTGGALHGYQSDNTRTWVHAGEPTEEFARAWDAVQAAQQAAFAALRPGAPCRGVDEAARAVLTEAGYGPGYRCFTHRVGHGIGTEVHQSPYLDGGSEAVLEPGMTFSDEPGVYLPGQWGLRLEDIVMVTEEGGDHFGSWQQGPTSPA